jgi:hypothetical protein
VDRRLRGFFGKETEMTSNLHLGLSFGCALTTVALLAANASAESATPVIWNTDSAIANGSGCSSSGPFPDTYFIAAGGEVSVIFSRMGVDLSGSTAPNTAVTGCLVRIPVTIDGATAISELDQTMLWGWAKSLGSVGQVSVNSTFCGLNTNAASGAVSATVQGAVAMEESKSQSFFIWPPAKPFCQKKPVNCLFQANLGVAALRPDTSRSISVRIYGEDIEYEALAYWQMCP